MTDLEPNRDPQPDGEPEPRRRQEGELIGFPDLARLSPYQRLLDRRIVFLRGAIEETVADDLVAQLLALDVAGDEPVTLYIDSPGGSVTGTFAIYDTMQLLSAPVRTRCVGLAASGAAVLLATGTGTRSATPNARIMLHQPHGGIRGTAADITIAAQEFVWLRERMLAVLAERTGQSVERLRGDMDRDHWLSAEQALTYGVIDEIAVGARRPGSPPELATRR